MLDWLYEPGGWLALLTLTAMEVVLGIDNVIFISLIGSRLPERQARFARMFGLSLALVFRCACLAMLTWLIALTQPVLTIAGRGISWRDMVLVSAGLFLLVQATLELHDAIDAEPEEAAERRPRSVGWVVLNIAAMDLVFSFDSILTAIGMAKDLAIMVIAVVISLLVMYVAADAVARFIRAHPTAKVLALSFLLLIGLSLIADGSGLDLPRGYLYFAMVFSAGVESLNIWARSMRQRRLGSGQKPPAAP